MGVFRGFISGDPNATHIEHERELSKRIVTPATAMSLFRVGAAARIAYKLHTDKRGVMLLGMGLGASDMEGKVARVFDKLVPQWGIGSTEFGAKADTYCDGAAILILCPAIVAAPHISPRSKVIMAGIGAQEVKKVAWAKGANDDYKALTERKLGEAATVYIEPTIDAKEAIARKAAAGLAALATHDLRDPVSRYVLDATCAGFGQAGMRQATEVYKEYDVTFQQMMEQLDRLPDYVAA